MNGKLPEKSSERRRLFRDRGWEIMLKYLDRLDDEDLIENTDSRSGASVVKTLFDALDKAEEGADADERPELPEIPDDVLDEYIRLVLESQGMAAPSRPRSGAKRAPLPHPETARC